MSKIKLPNNHNHVTNMHSTICTQQYLSYVLNVTTKQSCTSGKPTLYINTQQYKGTFVLMNIINIIIFILFSKGQS